MKFSNFLTVVCLMAISSISMAAEGGTAGSLLGDFTIDTTDIITFIGVIFAAVVTVGMAWMSVPMVVKGLRAIRSSM